MEYDRYAHHHILYILGILCLILTLVLSTLTLYVAPYLLFGWQYNVPGFIIFWVTSLRFDYYYSETAANWIVFSAILVPAILTGLVAFFASNRIDDEWSGRPFHLREGKRNPVWKQDLADSMRLAVKIGLLIAIVIFIALLF